MKRLLIAFSFLLPIVAHSRECTIVPLDESKSPDCVHCGSELKTPGDKSESMGKGLMDFVGNKKEQRAQIAKFKSYSAFLINPKNKKECSNYKSLEATFKNEFRTELMKCEKGPESLDRNKMICEYVLSDYSQKITDTFYAHWTSYGSDGKPKLIPGRTKEQIEAPIRSHHAWCTKVEAAYKNKLYINCGEVKEWVSEFDTAQRISAALKKNREVQEASKSVEKSREEMLNQACKYFDNNPATTFTKDLYLTCVTR